MLNLRFTLEIIDPDGTRSPVDGMEWEYDENDVGNIEPKYL